MEVNEMHSVQFLCSKRAENNYLYFCHFVFKILQAMLSCSIVCSSLPIVDPVAAIKLTN